MKKSFDVSVSGQMGFYVCNLNTRKASRWTVANVKDAIRDPGEQSFPVEGSERVRPLVAGMVKAGLKVEVNGVDMAGFSQ